MEALVCVVANVGLVSAVIVSIVIDRRFRGQAGPDGVDMAVSGEEDDRVVAPVRRVRVNGRRKKQSGEMMTMARQLEQAQTWIAKQRQADAEARKVRLEAASDNE